MLLSVRGWAVAPTVGWGIAGTKVESFAVQPGMVRTDLWNPEKTDVKGKFAAFITGAYDRGQDGLNNFWGCARR